MFEITYGKNSHNSYLDAGEDIVKDFDQNQGPRIVDKINQAFFGGGVFAPKSFSALASFSIPESPFLISHDGNDKVTVEIGRRWNHQLSWCVFFGYIESIPFIGSAIAAIGIVGNLYNMYHAHKALERSVVALKATPRTDYNVGRGASCHYTNAVFDAAVAYTVYNNHVKGSLLALIPFAKPLVRFFQAAVYQPPVHPPRRIPRVNLHWVS